MLILEKKDKKGLSEKTIHQIIDKVNKMIGFDKSSSSRHAGIEQWSLLGLQVSSGDFSSNEEIELLGVASGIV